MEDMHVLLSVRKQSYEFICVFILQVKIDRMARVYQPKRYSLSLKSSVSVAHLLAAREDICNMVKTSSGSCREKTACAVNRVRTAEGYCQILPDV